MTAAVRAVAWLADLRLRVALWRLKRITRESVALTRWLRGQQRAEAAATDADLALNAGAVQADLLSQDGGAR